MEKDLYRLLGNVGALAPLLEGVVLPVTLAAPLRDSLLWFAAAGAASILTSNVQGITPVRLLLAPYPFEMEVALTAAAWLISA